MDFYFRGSQSHLRGLLAVHSALCPALLTGECLEGTRNVGLGNCSVRKTTPQQPSVSALHRQLHKARRALLLVLVLKAPAGLMQEKPLHGRSQASWACLQCWSQSRSVVLHPRHHQCAHPRTRFGCLGVPVVRADRIKANQLRRRRPHRQLPEAEGQRDRRAVWKQARRRQPVFRPKAVRPPPGSHANLG